MKNHNFAQKVLHKLKWVFLIAVLAVFMLVTFTSLSSFAAVVDVYGKGTYTDSTLTVDIYADCTLENILSYGVKLLYEKAELSVIDAAKNENVWYFGNASTRYPYMNPDYDTDGEVVIVGGKLDIDHPLEGVNGEEILLGRVILERNGSPISTLSLTYGRTGSFKNFTTTDGLILDDLANGVHFGPVTIVYGSDGDELAADFGDNGLWHYSGSSWSKKTPWNPDDDLAGWSGGMAVDFGGEGLWNHDGTSWSKKTWWNPGSGGLAGWSGGLAVDFDGEGLWVYNGTSWSKKTWWDPGSGGMAGWSGGLAVDFDTNGLWNFDGTSWRKKTPWDPGNGGLADWSGGLSVDFDANGLWSYDGSSWRKLTPWNPEGMAGWNGGLGVDFGSNGLWSYDGSSWSKLTPWNPTGMSGWGGGLAVDFGANGLWNYDGTAWSKKTPWHCENLGDVDLN